MSARPAVWWSRRSTPIEPEIVQLNWDDASEARLYYGQDVIESLKLLPDASVHTVCTSPPYWGLRDYGMGDKQIGLEETPDEFVTKLVEVFREVARVLRPDGTLWLNLGDSYNNRTKVRTSSHQPALNDFEDSEWSDQAAQGGVRMSNRSGLKEKDLVGIPWRVAFALQADGWYLRSDIIWAKSSCMPEPVRDRPTKAHEYVFLLAHPDSGGRYFYDADAIREPVRNPKPVLRKLGSVEAWAETRNAAFSGSDASKGQPKGHAGTHEGGRNKRSWWNVNPKPYKGAHFAVWPPKLVRPMILAGSPRGGVVLDPFSGSATTGMVALQEGRNYIGIDLNAEYLPLAEARLLGRRAPPSDKNEGDFSLIEDLFG